MMAKSPKAVRGTKPTARKKPARLKRRHPPATSDGRTQIERGADALDQTAALWVAAIGSRVRELAHELGRLDNLMGHPERLGASTMLKTVLDRSAVGRLIHALYEAEGSLADLLLLAAVTEVPDLVGECEAAAVASGLT